MCNSSKHFLSIRVLTVKNWCSSHPTNNSGTAAALCDHVAGTKANLPSGESRNTVDQSRRDCLICRFVCRLFRRLVLAVERQFDELTPIGYQICSKLTACPRERMQRIQVHRLGDPFDGTASVVRNISLNRENRCAYG